LFIKPVKKNGFILNDFKLWTFNCGFKYGFLAAKVSNLAVLTSGNHNSFRYILSSIGVEYMYIRKQETLSGFKKIRVNDNNLIFSIEEKKSILNKLNQTVSFENFFCTKYVGQKKILSWR
jgi:2-oxoglutarate dehydrogenase complex dehydrogenase (E1) component-like enzyme